MGKAKDGPWEADYRYSEKFTDETFINKLVNYTLAEAVVNETKAPNIPPDVPAYLRPLYRFPLLSREGEWMLFMKMNYHKYQAFQLSQEMATNAACVKLIQPQYDRMMRIAYATRNDIANHNLRLVASLAKKQRKEGMTVEDWFSNGNISLLRAIDKYDCNKANPYVKGSNIKFSTYASWAILKNFWRDHFGGKRELSYTNYTVDELPIPDPDSMDPAFDPLNEDLIRLFGAMERMDKREKKVLLGRFGIGRESATLDRLGVEHGITRERVRQIQKSAVRHIKEDLGIPLSDRERKDILDKKQTKAKVRVV
jgi:RNA polymerase sigma factor (sigma-70 family)